MHRFVYKFMQRYNVIIIISLLKIASYCTLAFNFSPSEFMEVETPYWWMEYHQIVYGSIIDPGDLWPTPPGLPQPRIRV